MFWPRFLGEAHLIRKKTNNYAVVDGVEVEEPKLALVVVAVAAVEHDVAQLSNRHLVGCKMAC